MDEEKKWMLMTYYCPTHGNSGKIKPIELTKKDILLIQNLNHHGNLQSELIKSGFNATLINSMVRKNLLIKTK